MNRINFKFVKPFFIISLSENFVLLGAIPVQMTVGQVLWEIVVIRASWLTFYTSRSQLRIIKWSGSERSF